MNENRAEFHGTTIIAIRHQGQLAMAGDGQVTMGHSIVKTKARKVRRLAGNQVLAGFAGATADAFTLFSRLEEKLEEFNKNLTRAAVELAKDWRTIDPCGAWRRCSSRLTKTHHYLFQALVM